MFRRAVPVLCCLAMTLAATTARAGNPWEELMGPGKPNLWTDPDGRFWLDLPVGWTAQLRKGGEPFVDFWKTHPDYGQTAHVEVEMRTVPPGTKAAHFAARVQDDVKKHAPMYRVIAQDPVRVSGVPAVRILFSFQEKNNAELKTEVLQHIFVVGERAFIVSMLTTAGSREVFEDDFEKMIRNFGGRGPGDDGPPMPKARKKVRSGEMVNPDAVHF